MYSNKIEDVYIASKQKINTIIKKYMDVSSRLNDLSNNKTMKSQIGREKENFNQKFVKLNLEIQNLKMQNEALFDEVSIKEDALKKFTQEVTETTKFIDYYKDEIAGLEN